MKQEHVKQIKRDKNIDVWGLKPWWFAAVDTDTAGDTMTEQPFLLYLFEVCDARAAATLKTQLCLL